MRYYVSFKGYGFLVILLPILFITNGILFIIAKPDSDGFLGFMNQYIYIFWFISGAVGLIQVYRIYKRKVYFEINDQKMIYSFRRKSSVFEYNDAEFYTAKQSGSSLNINYKSLKSGKKKTISLKIFNIDLDEFLTLLNKYSKKNVFVKYYGEELRLIDKKDLW